MLTARHDLIVRTLAKLFRQVSAVVHVEPRIYGSERLRPDLDIIFPDQTLMMDVAITHPAAPSRHSSTPLAAATVTENAKISKYAKLAATHASSFRVGELRCVWNPHRTGHEAAPQSCS